MQDIFFSEEKLTILRSNNEGNCTHRIFVDAFIKFAFNFRLKQDKVTVLLLQICIMKEHFGIEENECTIVRAQASLSIQCDMSPGIEFWPWHLLDSVSYQLTQLSSLLKIQRSEFRFDLICVPN